jgi:hypothetical protein
LAAAALAATASMSSAAGSSGSDSLPGRFCTLSSRYLPARRQAVWCFYTVLIQLFSP